MSDKPQQMDRAEDSGADGQSGQMSALFAGMVLHHTQMALMLLGRMPHPQTGETLVDLDGARVLIDQLEMLDHKTRGNLEDHERRMLRESLMTLRMVFVEASNARSGAPAQEPPAGAKPDASKDLPGAETGQAPASSGSEPKGEPTESETRKKFSKKY
jgi:hypothetical protein